MKDKLIAAATVTATVSSAFAGGLDRSYTPVDLLFQEGNYAEFRLGYTDPSVDGTDIAGFKTGNVAKSYTNLGGGVKVNINDQMSMAFIYDQPYGVDVKYKDRTPVLDGTRAKATTNALTVLMRYQFNDNFSVYGGPRVVRADGKIELGGLAYGPGSGYKVKLGNDSAIGGVAGVAYERPDIALRVALTYHSQVKLSMESRESVPLGNVVPGATSGRFEFPSSNTSIKLPQSVRLDFQTGVAKDTLIFGNVRWSEWSKFDIIPVVLARNLSELNDTWSFELGAGRKFTEKFAGTLAFGYEPKRGDSLVSPLAPSNGNYSVTLGGRYNVTDRVTISSGIRYTWLIDAKPEVGTPDTQVADFKNNHAISYGMKIGINF